MGASPVFGNGIQLLRMDFHLQQLQVPCGPPTKTCTPPSCSSDLSAQLPTASSSSRQADETNQQRATQSWRGPGAQPLRSPPSASASTWEAAVSGKTTATSRAPSGNCFLALGVPSTACTVSADHLMAEGNEERGSARPSRLLAEELAHKFSMRGPSCLLS